MAIVIKRGARMFTGPDVPTVRRWISEGRVVASDLVDNGGNWIPIGEHPDFAGIGGAPPPPPIAAPQSPSRNSMGTPLQLGCFGAVMLVAGPVVGGFLFSSPLLAMVGVVIGVLCIVGALVAGVVSRR
jgi:hypothetical protein